MKTRTLRRHNVHQTLQYYENNFKLRTPYKVIVEGSVVVCAFKKNVRLIERISRYLQGDVNILTTKCIVKDVDRIVKRNKDFEDIRKTIKNLPIYNCKHKKLLPGEKCILSLLEIKSFGCIIATQNPSLQDKIRSKPGIPLLYMKAAHLTLDPPSKMLKNSPPTHENENEKKELMVVLTKISPNSNISKRNSNATPKSVKKISVEQSLVLKSNLVKENNSKPIINTPVKRLIHKHPALIKRKTNDKKNRKIYQSQIKSHLFKDIK